MADPERPQGVVLHLPDGTTLTPELIYRGRDRDGLHNWRTQVDTLPPGTRLAVEVMPAYTSVSMPNPGPIPSDQLPAHLRDQLEAALRNAGATVAPQAADTLPEPVDPPNAICPECLTGKCGNCNGQAWDHVNDEPTTCTCREDVHTQ